MKQFNNTISIPIKSYAEEEIPTMNKVIEALLINMYGDSMRDKAIYIGNFNYNNEESKICYYVASIVRSLYGRPIYIKCNFYNYFKFLYKTKQLFKKHRARRTNKKIRDAYDWINDILKANNLSDDFIFKIWEYLNEK